MSTVTMPELGEEISKATVSCWYVKVGDSVKEDDDLVELATDKATFNVPSPKTGILKAIYFPEGQEVKVGEALGDIE